MNFIFMFVFSTDILADSIKTIFKIKIVSKCLSCFLSMRYLFVIKQIYTKSTSYNNTCFQSVLLCSRRLYRYLTTHCVLTCFQHVKSYITTHRVLTCFQHDKSYYTTHRVLIRFQHDKSYFTTHRVLICFQHDKSYFSAHCVLTCLQHNKSYLTAHCVLTCFQPFRVITPRIVFNPVLNILRVISRRIVL